MKKLTNQMTAFLRRFQIGTRLNVSLLVICIIPIVVMMVMFYNSIERVIYDKVGASTRQSLQLFNSALNLHMDKCERIGDSIMMDSSVQNYFKTGLADDNFNKAVSRAFNNLAMWDSYMKGFALYDMNGTQLSYMGAIKLPDESISSVFEKCKEKGDFRNWTYEFDTKNTPYAVLCRNVYLDGFIGNQMGYILIYVDTEQLINTIYEDVYPRNLDIRQIIVEPESGLVVFRQHGEAGERAEQLFSDFPAVERMDSGYLTGKVEGQSSLIVMEHQPKTRWDVIGIIPKSQLMAEIYNLMLRVILVMALLAILCVALAVFIRKSINQPLLRMVRFTKRVAQGDFSRRLGDTSKDEMGYLSQNVDTMVEKISELFATNEQNQSKKRELELEILQYQINPHFLFNTLSSFQYIAQLNGITAISTGITCLCNLLRNTITKAEERIPLEVELNNISDYLEIQKIKYAGMFRVKYDIDPQTRQATVLRLMLQPIVENSVIHGISDGVLTIRIQSRLREGMLVITVSDDGKGFDGSAGDKSGEEKNKKFSGIGLNNVMERIKRNFGEEYGLMVTSKLGQGTTTLIHLPFILHHGEETTKVD